MYLNIESVFDLFNHIRSLVSIKDLLNTSTIDDVAALLQLKLGQPISDDYAMQLALFLAYSSILPNQNGGPFGAVILNDGRLISYGANHVTRLNDPTEHGEVNAIRQALGNYSSLNDSTLITSCYPCPMCLGCAIDHNISQIHYCSTPEDAKMYGNFKDQTLNDVLKAKQKTIPNSPTQFVFSKPDKTIAPASGSHGDSLIHVLQAVCKQYGFEPKEVSFVVNHPLSLSLFEYMALQWSGIPISDLVFIHPVHSEKVTFFHSDKYQHIGQKIFELYQQIGHPYGQED